MLRVAVIQRIDGAIPLVYSDQCAQLRASGALKHDTIGANGLEEIGFRACIALLKPNLICALTRIAFCVGDGQHDGMGGVVYGQLGSNCVIVDGERDGTGHVIASYQQGRAVRLSAMSRCDHRRARFLDRIRVLRLAMRLSRLPVRRSR